MDEILGDGSIGVHIGGFWNQLQHGKDADGYPRWQWIDMTPFSFENWSPGEPDEDTRINAQLLLKEIENIPPFHGNGYFELKRETLTSITSTTVTYLIILLQFRGS